MSVKLYWASIEFHAKLTWIHTWTSNFQLWLYQTCPLWNSAEKWVKLILNRMKCQWWWSLLSVEGVLNWFRVFMLDLNWSVIDVFTSMLFFMFFSKIVQLNLWKNDEWLHLLRQTLEQLRHARDRVQLFRSCQSQHECKEQRHIKWLLTRKPWEPPDLAGQIFKEVKSKIAARDP